MKKLDINQLYQINGGGCAERAVIFSVGAVLAAATLNPFLMAFCAAGTFANYQVCQ